MVGLGIFGDYGFLVDEIASMTRWIVFLMNQEDWFVERCSTAPICCLCKSRTCSISTEISFVCCGPGPKTDFHGTVLQTQSYQKRINLHRLQSIQTIAACLFNFLFAHQERSTG